MRVSMASKKRVRIEQAVSGLVLSPESLAAIDDEIAQLDVRRKFLFGVREAMASALGEQPARSTVHEHPKQANPKNETLGWLLDCYRTDKRSPYPRLKHSTKEHYNSCLRRIEQVADTELASLKTEDIQNLYDGWVASAAAKGKSGVAMAHSVITILRAVIYFGATVIENNECIRLSVMLRKMQFQTLKRRDSAPLSADQVKAFIAKAHEMGYPSIALAQAIQFQCEMSQRDVIGEWVPQSEPGVSDVTNKNEKWLRGLRWSDLDGNHVLARPQGNMSLRIAPLIMAELPNPIPQSGPMIVHEHYNLPWRSPAFRATWRRIARAADIPDYIRNMDSGPKGGLNGRGRSKNAAATGA